MKKIFFVLVAYCLLPTAYSFSQGTWTQKADFPGVSRIFSVGFSIGNFGYFGTGNSSSSGPTQEFWEYDPIQNTWTQKVNFPGVARWGAGGFSIGSKGYIGTGGYQDFWEWDQATNVWTQKANFGGAIRAYATGFSIGTKGYLGTGFTTDSAFNFIYYQDFYEYDPNTDNWIQKADFGGVVRRSAVGFSIGTKGYIGTGEPLIGPLLKDFWEYDTVNTWTQKADFGGGIRDFSVGFSIGSYGYIGTGNYSGVWQDFWEYDPSINIWTQRTDFGGAARYGATGFSIGTKGYIGTGYSYLPSIYYKDFWEYDPNGVIGITETNLENLISVYPNPFSTSTTIEVQSLKSKVISVILYDVHGTKVKTFDTRLTTNDFVLERGDLPSGVYFIHISSGNKTAVKKLVIQ